MLDSINVCSTKPITDAVVTVSTFHREANNKISQLFSNSPIRVHHKSASSRLCIVVKQQEARKKKEEEEAAQEE